MQVGFNNINTFGSYRTLKENKKENVQSPIKISPSTDVLELSNKKNTNRKKVGIAIALGGLVTAAILGIKGKSYKVSSVVDFKPAKTIKEAEAFALKKLDVTFLESEKANVDILNTLNEMMSKEKILNNKIPNFILFENNKRPDAIMALTDKIEGNNVLMVNVDSVKCFDKVIEKAFEAAGGIKDLISCKDGKYFLKDNNFASENMTKLLDLLNGFNNETSSYKDKLNIFNGLVEAIHINDLKKSNKIVKMGNFVPEGTLYHELGHMHHSDKIGSFANFLNNKELMNDFLTNKINIAQEVSQYSKADPLEFVAETYKGLRCGKTYSDEVMKLYNEYNGPKV